MSWRDYRSAPPPGTALCAASEVAPVARPRLAGPAGVFAAIVVRTPGGDLRAFVNACPHQYLPLDHLGPNILSADGARLMCTAHGAQFDAATGTGIAGEGLGCALDEIPVALSGGRVVIAG